MRRCRLLVSSAGLMLCGAMLGACGGGGSSGLAGKSPKQIVALTKAALQSARSTTLTASIETQPRRVFFTLDVFQSGAADGTFGTAAGQGSLVIVAHHVYLRGPVAFWEGLESVPAAEATKLAGRWIMLPENSTSSFSSLTLPGVIHALSGLHKKKITKLGPRTVDGRSAIGIRAKSFGTMWVATSGTPYPLEVTQKTSTGHGTITFSNWGKNSPPTAPARSLTPAQALASK